jgi:hypothetical protein
MIDDPGQEEYSRIPVQAVDQIGIAVRSLDARRRIYKDALGAVFEGVEEVADQ